MRTLHHAMQSFWGGFGLPAYLTGRVPDDAQLPYITYEAGQGEGQSYGILTAFVWVKEVSGVNAAEQRAQLLDTIAEAIPNAGRKLTFSGGYALLYRNSAGFISYYDDPTDRTILGGRISYEIHYFL